MIFYLVLLLWASHSVSVPTSLNEVSYPAHKLDEHGAPETLVAPSPPSWIPSLFPRTDKKHWKKSIDHEPWVEAEATLNTRTPDNATEGPQTAASDDFKTYWNKIKIETTCKTGKGAALTMDDMALNVGIIIADVAKRLHPSSTLWGENLPGSDDIVVWMHVEIFEWEPFVHAELIRNMFQMLVYRYACYESGKTKGGSVVATRVGQKHRKLAIVELYAEDAREQ